MLCLCPDPVLTLPSRTYITHRYYRFQEDRGVVWPCWQGVSVQAAVGSWPERIEFHLMYVRTQLPWITLASSHRQRRSGGFVGYKAAVTKNNLFHGYRLSRKRVLLEVEGDRYYLKGVERVCFLSFEIPFCSPTRCRLKGMIWCSVYLAWMYININNAI